jgi:energy-coupling factor transporter ATP-binding protein EcfA2
VKGNAVRLRCISNPVGINALATDQSLEMEPNGLTVVYGDNGSGKSGYVRILKHACRSRDDKSAILPDINGPKDALQSAKIAFQRGGINSQMNWEPDVAKHADLPSISIFDSKSANTHLSGQHQIAYASPPG